MYFWKAATAIVCGFCLYNPSRSYRQRTRSDGKALSALRHRLEFTYVNAEDGNFLLAHLRIYEDRIYTSCMRGERGRLPRWAQAGSTRKQPWCQTKYRT